MSAELTARAFYQSCDIEGFKPSAQYTVSKQPPLALCIEVNGDVVTLSNTLNFLRLCSQHTATDPHALAASFNFLRVVEQSYEQSLYNIR